MIPTQPAAPTPVYAYAAPVAQTPVASEQQTVVAYSYTGQPPQAAYQQAAYSQPAYQQAYQYQPAATAAYQPTTAYQQAPAAAPAAQPAAVSQQQQQMIWGQQTQPSQAWGDIAAASQAHAYAAPVQHQHQHQHQQPAVQAQWPAQHPADPNAAAAAAAAAVALQSNYSTAPPPYQVTASVAPAVDAVKFPTPAAAPDAYQRIKHSPPPPPPPPPQPELAPGSAIPAYSDTPEFYRNVARAAKPSPPWGLGHSVTMDLSTEMDLFVAFSDATDAERNALSDAREAIRVMLSDSCPDVTVQPVGVNAVALHPFKAPLMVAVSGSTIATDDSEAAAAAAAAARDTLVSKGCEIIRTWENHVGGTVVLVRVADTTVEAVVHVGPAAARALSAADIIKNGFGNSPTRRAALACLIAMLRQNMTIVDGQRDTLTEDAVAVMLLSVMNSYPEGDEPDAKRALLDFFLTFGFAQNFDSANLAVLHKGLQPELPKPVPTDALFVIDPMDQKSNLATAITATKLQYITAVFSYCYHVVSDFLGQEDPAKRRAQSPLSTVLGGEPFWPRVLFLASLGVEPYTKFVLDSWPRISQTSEAAGRGRGRGRR